MTENPTIDREGWGLEAARKAIKSPGFREVRPPDALKTAIISLGFVFLATHVSPDLIMTLHYCAMRMHDDLFFTLIYIFLHLKLH